MPSESRRSAPPGSFERPPIDLPVRPFSLPANWSSPQASPGTASFNTKAESKAKRRSKLWKRAVNRLCSSSASPCEKTPSVSEDEAHAAHSPRADEPTQHSKMQPAPNPSSRSKSSRQAPTTPGVQDSPFHNMVYALADLAVAAPVYALDQGVWSLAIDQSQQASLVQTRRPLMDSLDFRSEQSQQSHHIARCSKTPDAPPRIPTPDFGRRRKSLEVCREVNDGDSGYGSLPTMTERNLRPSESTQSWETVTSEQGKGASEAQTRNQPPLRPRPLPHSLRTMMDSRQNAQGTSRGASWFGSVMERGFEPGPAISGIGWATHGRQVSHEQLNHLESKG